MGTRILVLDDELFAQASLERVLEAEGAEVLCFQSVEEAMPLLSLYEFDAAIVDYWLLGDPGLEAVKVLRRGGRPCASVMITGTRDTSLTEECIEAGADDLLVKPFELERLITALNAAVSRTRHWRKIIADGPNDHVGDRRFREHGNPIKPDDADSWAERRLKELVRAAEAVADKYGLSDRETSVFIELIQGYRNQGIADHIGVSERTVKFHVTNIMKKTGVNGRSKLLLLVFFHAPSDDDTPPPKVITPPKPHPKKPPKVSPARPDEAAQAARPVRPPGSMT